jgi:hypothetical protein
MIRCKRQPMHKQIPKAAMMAIAINICIRKTRLVRYLRKLINLFLYVAKIKLFRFKKNDNFV